MLPFDGLTAEEEKTHELACKAQLGAVLHHNLERHICFSKQLLHLADPEFVPSPPSSPWRRRGRPAQKKKALVQRRQPSRAPSVQQSDDDSDKEPGSPKEAQNLEDLSEFFQMDSEDEG